MTDNREKDLRDLDPIEALLPWYAAGTLDPDEARQVEEALAARPELRASLATVEEDLDQTVALNQSLGAPKSDVWARIAAVAQAEPRKASLASRIASRFASLIGVGATPRPARLAFVAAAIGVVVLAQSATIVELAQHAPGGAYQTATGPKTNAVGAQVLVSFAPDARLDALGRFLAEHHAAIVDGPRGGLYTLRAGDKALGKDEMAALLTDLSKSPLVTSALPAAK